MTCTRRPKRATMVFSPQTTYITVMRSWKSDFRVTGIIGKGVQAEVYKVECKCCGQPFSAKMYRLQKPLRGNGQSIETRSYNRSLVTPRASKLPNVTETRMDSEGDFVKMSFPSSEEVDIQGEIDALLYCGAHPSLASLHAVYYGCHKEPNTVTLISNLGEGGTLAQLLDKSCRRLHLEVSGTAIFGCNCLSLISAEGIQ